MERLTSVLTVLHVATINKPISMRNGYGPIETVIHNLDAGLVALGHRSIVACSGDSSVVGEKWPTVAESLGDYCLDRTPYLESQIDQHLARALARASHGDIDIVHMHEWHDRVYTGQFRPPVPVVMTLHVPASESGYADTRARAPRAFHGPQVLHPVGISEYQRRQYEGVLDVRHLVHHGIDAGEGLFNGSHDPSDYLFHIGRITQDKGQDIAIEVARRTGKKLILAGCVQNKEADREFFRRIAPSLDLVVDLASRPVMDDYFETVMQPLLRSDKQVIYVGELRDGAAQQWYRHADATLFPIRWGEPFGMVLIESMAAGTPVIGFREGAVPEIVRDGETGFVVSSVDEMVAAVGRIDQISRRACWQHVNTNFSIPRMAAGYAAVYREVIATQRAASSVRPQVGQASSRPVVAA